MELCSQSDTARVDCYSLWFGDHAFGSPAFSVVFLRLLEQGIGVTWSSLLRMVYHSIHLRVDSFSRPQRKTMDCGRSWQLVALEQLFWRGKSSLDVSVNTTGTAIRKRCSDRVISYFHRWRFSDQWAPCAVPAFIQK